jgi:hypothetical protein
MKQLTQREYDYLPYEQQKHWEEFIQIKEKENSEWKDYYGTRQKLSTFFHDYQLVYRPYMENTTNELVREYRNLLDMFRKLKLTDEQIIAINMRLRYERYHSYQEGLENGKKKVQVGLKDLLGLHDEEDKMWLDNLTNKNN